jgi:hypothetical protein
MGVAVACTSGALIAGAVKLIATTVSKITNPVAIKLEMR